MVATIQKHKPQRAMILAAAVAVNTLLLMMCGSAFGFVGGVIQAEYGAKANATTGGNYCEPYSVDTCQIAEAGATPGGFAEFAPRAVAVNPSNGNVYVADTANDRIQELSASGEFVLMFGKDVNETTGGNVCTAAEVTAGAKCKIGVEGGEAGALYRPTAVTMDPSGKHLYVAENAFPGNNRVDEFTPEGQFVLMLGLHVNKTTGGNLCTQIEVEHGSECQKAPGVFEGAEGVNEHGAFVIFAEVGTGGGDEIVAGGPEELLYVGSEHRVQEFKADGTWVREISLEGISSGTLATATAVAVDPTSGEVYLTYPFESGQPANVIYKFAQGSTQPETITLSSRESGATISIEGLALNPASSELAATEVEVNSGAARTWFGSMLDAGTGKLKATFRILAGTGVESTVVGVTFNPSGEFYVAANARREIIRYAIETGADLIASSTAPCTQSPVAQETRVTLECSLSGTANPLNVAETEAWFEWVGGSVAGATAHQQIPTGSAPVPVNSSVPGLAPNTTYHVKLAAEDHNFHSPEPPILSEEASFTTSTVPAVIIGEPNAEYVKSESVDLYGELDPENANTLYEFEYALVQPGVCEHLESCPHVDKTNAQESNVYRQIATTQEATGLEPSSTYIYRLTATNSAGTATSGEGRFTTAPPVMPQALTGEPSNIGVTTAVITGQINPDGQPAVYAFELGAYNGAQTEYSIVATGSTGEGRGFIPVQAFVSNLQPATMYAYRIRIDSPYGHRTGVALLVKTNGFSSVLPRSPEPIMVPMPNTHFPRERPAKCKRGYKRDKRGHCVRVKKAKHAKVRNRRTKRRRHKG